MTTAEMPCAELVERVTEYFEGAMPPSDVARFEEHLGECEDCRTYVAQLRATVRLTGELREDDVPEDMLQTLSQLFVRVREERRGDDGP